MKRRNAYNAGAWAVERERFQITDEAPPSPDRSTTIDRVLDAMIGNMGLRHPGAHQNIAEHWEHIAGPQVAQHSRPVGIHQGCLILYVDHSIWLQELKRRFEATLLKRIQADYPQAGITRLRIQLDPGN